MEKAEAQTLRQPYFRNYTTDQGLPSPEVHDILQDRKGYLWIATDNGLSRFDGYTFRNFGAGQGLNNNVVFHLQEDHQGRIWMQTMSGNIYYYDQDSIYAYPYNHLIEQYNDYFSSINNFIYTAEGTLYTALYGLGILKIEANGQNELINAKHQKNMVVLQLPEFQRALYASISQLSLRYLGWEPRSDRSLHELGIYSDTLITNCKFPRNPGNNISYTYADSSLLLINIGKELYIFYDLVQQPDVTLPTTIAEATRIGDAFWVGFNDRQGVRYYQRKEDIASENFQFFLPGKSVSAICPDRTGGYWFGTLNDGIFYAPNLELEAFLADEIPVNFQVISFERDRPDRLLFGTDKGGVYALDSLGNTTWLHSIGSPVFDLWRNPDDDALWIAGTPALVLSGRETHRLTYMPELNLGNPVSAKKLNPAPDTALLYSSSSIGFEIFDIQRKEVVYTTLNQPGQKRVNTTFEDYDGRIWIGNTRGLFQFKNGQFISPEVDHPFFHLRVEDIDQLADSTLVIATKGGGILLWKDTYQEVIDERRGLVANMIENIAVDRLQQIWVGTLNGLNKISKDPDNNFWQVKRLTMAHGLPSNEINALCEFGNWMFAATSRGVVKLPLIDTSRAPTPTVFLETVLINGHPRQREALLDLGFRERNVQLQFLCINFKFAGNILYRYRLTTDEEWSFTQNQSVNYAALAPGQYTFEVQAQNEDGRWGDSMSLPFSIAPPLWQRWWFVFSLLALLLGLIYYQYRLRISRLERESAIEREISDLQRSALQAQMNPHFIFNCLNSIQNFIASGDKENAMQYLSRFAKLVRTTLHASAQTTISLEEESQMIENYLELEKLRFGKRFEYKINIDPRLDQFEVMLPPLLVQPFVENAIIHGFNFVDKKQTGQLYVAYEQYGPQLRITVRDNGIGIYHSRQQTEGPKQGNSLGMAITEKRLRLHQIERLDQNLQIQQLHNSDGSIAGTEIIILLNLA